MNKFYFILYTIGFLILLIGCSAEKVTLNKRSCSIDKLLLDESDYPPNTILNVIHSPIAEKPKESASRTANYNADGMGQIVIQYSTIDNTVAEYNSHQKSIFDPNEVLGSWETPSILDLDNLSAERYKIACGNVVSFGSRCFMIGQYEEYFVLFSADISGKGVTHELFRDLILKTDNRMISCLNKQAAQ